VRADGKALPSAIPDSNLARLRPSALGRPHYRPLLGSPRHRSHWGARRFARSFPSATVGRIARARKETLRARSFVSGGGPPQREGGVGPPQRCRSRYRGVCASAASSFASSMAPARLCPDAASGARSRRRRGHATTPVRSRRSRLKLRAPRASARTLVSPRRYLTSFREQYPRFVALELRAEPPRVPSSTSLRQEDPAGNRLRVVCIRYALSGGGAATALLKSSFVPTYRGATSFREPTRLNQAGHGKGRRCSAEHRQRTWRGAPRSHADTSRTHGLRRTGAHRRLSPRGSASLVPQSELASRKPSAAGRSSALCWAQVSGTQPPAPHWFGTPGTAARLGRRAGCRT
jgi:hypothetical protein